MMQDDDRKVWTLLSASMMLSGAAGPNANHLSQDRISAAADAARRLYEIIFKSEAEA